MLTPYSLFFLFINIYFHREVVLGCFSVIGDQTLILYPKHYFCIKSAPYRKWSDWLDTMKKVINFDLNWIKNHKAKAKNCPGQL